MAGCPAQASPTKEQTSKTGHEPPAQAPPPRAPSGGTPPTPTRHGREQGGQTHGGRLETRVSRQATVLPGGAHGNQILYDKIVLGGGGGPRENGLSVPIPNAYRTLTTSSHPCHPPSPLKTCLRGPWYGSTRLLQNPRRDPTRHGRQNTVKMSYLTTQPQTETPKTAELLRATRQARTTRI